MHVEKKEADNYCRQKEYNVEYDVGISKPKKDG